MRTVTYKSVVDKISGYLLEDGGMSAEDAGLANRLINSHYKAAVEFYFWPELTLIERRQFRPSWNSGTTYAASATGTAVEVYYPPARAYYQSLQANTGQAPASGSSFTENSAYWAASRGSYSGNDWVSGGVYAVGRQVRNPADELYYQCITAHTAGGSFDATKFGVLTPFVRSLAYQQSFVTAPNAGNAATPFGEIKKIWDRDPDVNRDACEYQFRLRNNFVVCRGINPVVYAEFRVRPNNFSGSNWAVASAYNVGDQVYYDPTGEYYACVAGTTGTVPTNPAFWLKLDFPYFLQEFTAQSVYAAMVTKEEEVPEDFTIQLTAGWPLLQAELQKIERQQGQTRQLRVIDARAA